MRDQPSIHFEPATKSDADAKLVMSWRNDPETRKMFYHSDLKKWPAFGEEYRKTYFQHAKLPPLFAYHNGERVGFLRFNPYQAKPFLKNTVDIDININPNKRGHGFGAAILSQAANHLLTLGFKTVVAEIKQINTASIRAFEKAGFLYHDSFSKKISDTGEIIPISRFTMTQTLKKNSLKKERVFVIAEAGSNWRCGTPARDRKMAEALIDVAVEAGADAVKFQTYKPETVYVANAGDSDYLAKNGIKESITDIFKDLSMPYELIGELAAYCKKQGIQFLSTPFSIADAKAVDPFVKIHKLASYEISHAKLIEFLASTGKPLIISTGGTTYDDIAWAIQHFRKHGGSKISLMQCTAKYPTPLANLNLNVIPELARRFQVPVGLSDHSRDPIIGPTGAVALGATIIEKHYTLHNRLPGADHGFAITADELGQMVSAIRKMEEALGSSEKIVQDTEKELKSFAQRAIQATQKIKAGEVLKLGKNIDILRPGKQKQGLHPKHLIDIEGRKAARSIALGQGIQKGDFK